MTIENLKLFFMWGTVINLGFLMYYFFMMLLFGKWILVVFQKTTKLSENTANTILFAAMTFYKILWIALFLVPYLSLSLMT